MTNESSAKIAATRADWVVEHRERYIKSGGTDGHIENLIPVNGHPFSTHCLIKYKGRKSGKTFITALSYGDIGGEVVICASKGGADHHPEWYNNIVASKEIEDYIREHLAEDGRVDLDELQMTFRSGVIHLDGTLPSEAQHQIVLQYIADFAGIQEVVDRLVINELLWEREDRTDMPEDQEPSSGTLSEAMEDMIESDQEDRNYQPPEGPVQEKT